jgi:peptidoglycan/LPS O-acetylase OafA/YrhL
MRTIGYSVVDFMFAGLLVILIRGRQRILLAVCRWRVLVWLGTISYGLYLLHIPAATVVRRFTPVVNIYPGGSVESVVCLLAAVLAAWVSWTIFESPILKLKNRFAVSSG